MKTTLALTAVFFLAISSLVSAQTTLSLTTSAGLVSATVTQEAPVRFGDSPPVTIYQDLFPLLLLHGYENSLVLSPTGGLIVTGTASGGANGLGINVGSGLALIGNVLSTTGTSVATVLAVPPLFVTNSGAVALSLPSTGALTLSGSGLSINVGSGLTISGSQLIATGGGGTSYTSSGAISLSGTTFGLNANPTYFGLSGGTLLTLANSGNWQSFVGVSGIGSAAFTPSGAYSASGALFSVTTGTLLTGSGTLGSPLTLASSGAVDSYLGIGSAGTMSAAAFSTSGALFSVNTSGGFTGNGSGSNALALNLATTGGLVLSGSQLRIDPASFVVDNLVTGSLAIGSNGLSQALQGNYNISVGVGALQVSGTCDHNVAIGENALNILMHGSHNTAVGINAAENASTLNNTVALGYNAQPTTSNQGVFGNASVNQFLLGASTMNVAGGGWNLAGGFTATSGSFGTISTSSTALVTGLNANYLGGLSAAAFALSGATSPNAVIYGTPNYATSATLSAGSLGVAGAISGSGNLTVAGTGGYHTLSESGTNTLTISPSGGYGLTLFNGQYLSSGMGGSSGTGCTTSGGTSTVDFNQGNVQRVQLSSGTSTIAFANPRGGGRYEVILRQPTSGGSGYATFVAPAGWSIIWANGTVGTLSTTTSAADLMGVTPDGVSMQLLLGISPNYY